MFCGQILVVLYNSLNNSYPKRHSSPLGLFHDFILWSLHVSYIFTKHQLIYHNHNHTETILKDILLSSIACKIQLSNKGKINVL